MSTSLSHFFPGQAPNAETRRMQDLLREFYADNGETKRNPTPYDKSKLQDFLRSQKICSTSPGRSDYLDEHDAKMRLIPQVCDALIALQLEVPDQVLASLWTGLWITSASNLENLLGKLRDPNEWFETHALLKNFGNYLPPLLRNFRGLAPPKDGTEDKTMYKRDSSQSTSALRRDNKRCVITGAPHPDVCHIFPFASLRRRGATNTNLGAMAMLWGEHRIRQLRVKLAGRYAFGASDNVNIVDTARNMISLNPQLHDWWGRGFFALEPMGEPVQSSDTSETSAGSSKKQKLQGKWSIKLRFHWLRKTDVPTLTSTVDFRRDPLSMLVAPDPERPVAAVDLKTWRPVESGQVFTVSAEDPNELPDHDILLLQWDILRMWRLAGGADPEIYSDNPFDSDDEADMEVDEKPQTTGNVTESGVETAFSSHEEPSDLSHNRGQSAPRVDNSPSGSQTPRNSNENPNPDTDASQSGKPPRTDQGPDS
ncbi:hypothetical protein LY76DRAFT_246800 [Colletotrichum caudatum]|nr:hypothetical protein LY76DRAFT_246800 [Colletotrichum caudatum]